MVTFVMVKMQQYIEKKSFSQFFFCVKMQMQVIKSGKKELAMMF